MLPASAVRIGTNGRQVSALESQTRAATARWMVSPLGRDSDLL